MDDQNQSKNLILAMALSMGVILIWSIMFPPEPPADDPSAGDPAAISIVDENGNEVALIPPAASGDAAATTGTTVAEPLPETLRIPIDTPSLTGSIALTGARLDDLVLRDTPETLDPDSPDVRLFIPSGEDGAYYAHYGWLPAGALGNDAVPGLSTPWELESGEALTVESPVTLRWDNGAGLVFRRTIAIDEDYLFTITQSVENTGEAEVRLAPYGSVTRHGLPEDLQNFFVIHEGIVQISDGTLNEVDYDEMPDFDILQREGTHAELTDVTESGWIGFTSKYWMAALVPGAGQPFTAAARYIEAQDIYQTQARLPVVSVAPGETSETTTLLFAGAKEWDILNRYQ
jgi:YidC/Oxa1 family membrane protein insertase